MPRGGDLAVDEHPLSSVDGDLCRASVGGVKPLRALHVINGRFFGGGHKSTLLLMANLDALGGVVTELCTLGDGGGLPLRGRSATVVAFDGRYNHPWVLIRTALRLRQVIAAIDPDIVHTHGLDADLVGALALAGCRAKHISHLRITPPSDRHESWKADLRKSMLRWLTKWRGTHFIAVSEAVRQQMAGYYGLSLGHITTVRNGVDLEEFAGYSRDPDFSSLANGAPRLIIGSAGRLAPMKGFGHLVDAAAILKSRGLDFELRIAGLGSELVPLEAYVRLLGLHECVRFVGHVEDMRSFYAELDVFMLPSVSTEGLPLVVLEAMAMGVPVVATDLAGTPEVIDDAVNGLLVPPGDPAAIATALMRLNDANLRRGLASAGLDTIRTRFTVQRVALEVAAVYRQEGN